MNLIEKAGWVFSLLMSVLLFVTMLGPSERDQLVARAEFWKQLYLLADSDAKYVNCLELDDNFVICEKPRP